jgi:hypothetical protein
MKNISLLILFSLSFIISWKPTNTVLTDIPPASVKFKKHSCKLDSDLKVQIKNIILNYKDSNNAPYMKKFILLMPSNGKEEWEKNHMIGFCRTHLIIDFLSENGLWNRDRIMVMEPETFSKTNEPEVYLLFVDFD